MYMTLDIYKNLIGSNAGMYMLRQTLTILLLYIGGYTLISLVKKEMDHRAHALLSYPLGISVFSVLGFLLLITGIRFNLLNILISYACLTGIIMVYRVKSGRGVAIPRLPYRLSLMIIPAAIAASGLLPQIISNDSVYYYSVYPSILVSDGFLSPALDKFLTDVGQTTAVLESLPFMAGFDETFGIQHFLSLNFVPLFFDAVYECTGKDSKRLFRFTAAALCTLFLLTSEPFIVLSSWILSNAYFMELFFIAFILLIKTADEEKTAPEYDLILFFLIAMLIMCRMEGGVLVFVLSLCFSSTRISKGRMIRLFAIPLSVMELGYYVNLYFRMGVNPLYSFLDIRTAAIMAALIILLFVYIIFIRDRLPKDLLPALILGLLLIGNTGLMIINRTRYLTNLKAFILNIRQGNGWGIFFIMIVSYILIFAFECVRRRFKDISPEIFIPAALTLAIFGVCFARGGVLAVRTSDSGNRVLMEMTPLIVYSIYRWSAGWITDAPSRPKDGDYTEETGNVDKSGVDAENS